MKYFVTHDNQQYGPYSLVDLQLYLAQGNIQPTDLARGEGLHEWVPVQRIVTNISAQQPPPSENYGRAPVYSNGSAVGPQAAVPASPVPPGLHWAILLLFSVVTFNIFGMIWMFVEAAYAHKLRTKSKPLLFYGLGIPVVFVAAVLSTMPDVRNFALLFEFAGASMMIAGHFSIKNALEDYYNRIEPIHLQLSGVVTFFFNVFYFQYHLSKIRKWKLTGGGEAHWAPLSLRPDW